MGNENITPNILQSMVLEDSGIEYSDYFDYIYHFSESYSVLHKEHVDINNDNFDI